MNCLDCKENLDLYIDNELEDSLCLRFEEHASECSQCNEMVSREHDMHQALESIPVPMPEAGFFEQSLARTVAMTKTHDRKRWLATGFGSAIAAGIVGWMVLGQPMNTAEIDQAPIARLIVTVDVPRTIRLSINSPTELTNANFFVTLPAGVEIPGFGMQSEIDWTTTIKKGSNILELPIVLRSGTGGTIFARLEHENKSRTFEFSVSTS